MQLATNTEPLSNEYAGRKVEGNGFSAALDSHGGAAPAPPWNWGVTMSSKQTLSVLIVDRDHGAASALTDYLMDQGYYTETCSDPERVVAEVKQGRFQLVMLDVSPPEGEGVELLQRIRRADSDLCVIATTSSPTVEVAVRALKSQAFDYLCKPLKEEELAEAISGAIREKGLLVDLETRLNQVVGQRIRERRSSESLTLKQVANRTGLSVSLISQIELGKSAASMSTLHKLATALQVKMTYFFETV
jgi:DNA-binding response OmpR family regulator